MASTRQITREKRIGRKRNPEARNALKATIKDPNVDPKEALQAMFKLQGRDRNESDTRKRLRCWSCGRPRGVYRRFGLCRCCVRKFFNLGYIPGLRKSSW